MMAFEQRPTCDSICGNCIHYQDDFEMGGMYGLCMIAKVLGKSGKSVVKEAYQYCNEDV